MFENDISMKLCLFQLHGYTIQTQTLVEVLGSFCKIKVSELMQTGKVMSTITKLQ